MKSVIVEYIKLVYNQINFFEETQNPSFLGAQYIIQNQVYNAKELGKQFLGNQLFHKERTDTHTNKEKESVRESLCGGEREKERKREKE